MADYTTLDEGLAILSAYSPDLSNDFTNHLPMAAEALCALGRADAVLPLIARNRHELLPKRPADDPVAPLEWQSALGNERAADWSALFEAEIANAPWRAVLRTWLPRLMPGFSAAALHGIIRVGHAVRSLEQNDTALRREELAGALGYWAAHYAAVPVDRGATDTLLPEDALARVPKVPPERSTFRGSITSGLVALTHMPEFARVFGLIGMDDPAATLSGVTETFARLYLANARDGLSTIVFIHGVTGATALRSLLPYLSASGAQDAVRHAWQAGAALYAAFAIALPSDSVSEPRESEAELVDLAVSNGDEHAIKFMEANLREYALRPSPAYLAAGKHALGMLSA